MPRLRRSTAGQTSRNSPASSRGLLEQATPAYLKVYRRSPTFRNLAVSLDVGLSIQLCICRPGDAILAPAIPTGVIVLLGGPRGGLRRSREQRLADRLARTGHPVLFVTTSRQSPVGNRTTAR